MRIKRISAAVALTAAGALVISGCAAGGGDTGDDSGLVEGSSITAAWNQAFFSMNGNTSFGNATANNNINYLTLDGFNYYNNTPELVQNTSFGTYELSRRPADGQVHDRRGRQLVRRHADRRRRHDAQLGRAVACARHADFDPADFTDPDTGEFTDASRRTSSTSTAVPALTRTSVSSTTCPRSATTAVHHVVYSSPFVDWEVAFGMLGEILPAHVVGKNALGIDDNEEAKQAVLDAIENEDDAALAPISAFWNSGFNFTELPDDPELYLASGPYMINDFVADQYITLTANPQYKGDNTPNIEEITVRFIPDPLAPPRRSRTVRSTSSRRRRPPTSRPRSTRSTASRSTPASRARTSTSTCSSTRARTRRTSSRTRRSARRSSRRFPVRRSSTSSSSRSSATTRSCAARRSSCRVAEGYDESVANNGSDAFAEVDIEGAKALLAESGITNPEVCILYASNNPRRVNEFALIQASANQAGFNVTDCGSSSGAASSARPARTTPCSSGGSRRASV